MADIFDVLADGTRRELLIHLLRHSESGAASGPTAGEVAVSELVSELGISQPTVSKHLKVLRDHGLVTVREEGQHRYYRLDSRPLDEPAAWLAPFVDDGTAESGPPAEDAASTVFVAWAGAEVGERVGRRAAETAHSARVALEAAQEKLQGAQKRVAARLPQFPRGS
ncbi:ArsR/SmtB family transcription factor [Lysinimonas soli]|uniref:ArsR/SmtB family transcription factor n=1 Tax=Lysinimonas soli TaxID=1074233 RepID=A0ABW0NRH4_9MICO